MWLTGNDPNDERDQRLIKLLIGSSCTLIKGLLCICMWHESHNQSKSTLPSHYPCLLAGQMDANSLEGYVACFERGGGSTNIRHRNPDKIMNTTTYTLSHKLPSLSLPLLMYRISPTLIVALGGNLSAWMLQPLNKAIHVIYKVQNLFQLATFTTRSHPQRKP